MVKIFLFVCLFMAALVCGQVHQWAVEFEGDWNEQEHRAATFASIHGLLNEGRIGDLNAFSFKLPDSIQPSKKDSYEATLNYLASLESLNTRAEPKHPLPDVEAHNELVNSVMTDSSVSTRSSQQSLSSEGVLWIKKQVFRKMTKRSIESIAISDPLYATQFHLHQYSSRSVMSLNVTGAWAMGYTGSGVTIAVCDDGLQHTHPDIKANYVPSGSYNFDYNKPDPAPTNMRSDYHGTASAGVAAARDDGRSCGVGVAYRAGLSGIAILQDDSLSDLKESRALQYKLAINQIYSNSWGPPDGGTVFMGPGPLTKQAISLGIRSGRNGLGAIYVWAGGNGGPNDNCNYDGYASSRHVLTIGAIDNSLSNLGKISSFSEECAALLVVAPSASNPRGYIQTTDLMGDNGRVRGSDCNERFSGTSAACPEISGVVALMLQANPSLTWLDVQRVLIETAIRNDPTSDDWTRNGAGYWINHKYGFGLADATSAVQRALELKNEKSMDKEVSLFYLSSIAVPFAATSDGWGVSIDIYVPEDIKIHHVEVVFDKTVCRDSAKLRTELISPKGTVSVLSKSHPPVNAPNLSHWTFTSRRLWQEPSKGKWKITVQDTTRSPGSIDVYSLRIYGTPTSSITSNVVKVRTSAGTYIPQGSTPVPSATPIPASPVPLSITPVSTPVESSPAKKAQNTQVLIAVLCTILGLLIIGVLVSLMVWYYKNQNNENYEYGNIGMNFDLEELDEIPDDGLVGQEDNVDLDQHLDDEDAAGAGSVVPI